MDDESQRGTGVDAITWTCFVALGDSFTEGLDDADETGGFRSWADLLAQRLDDRAPVGSFRYANLAVRDRLLPQITEQQVPEAVALQVDLVSLVGGGSDVLRPGSDLDALAERLEQAVAALRASGADVLLATGVDPVKAPLVDRSRGTVATYNSHIWSIARRQGAHVLDLWGMRALQDPQMWAADGIHLTAAGHRRVALQALEALGIGADQDWAARPPSEDAEWVREYVGPWVGRPTERSPDHD